MKIHGANPIGSPSTALTAAREQRNNLVEALLDEPTVVLDELNATGVEQVVAGFEFAAALH